MADDAIRRAVRELEHSSELSGCSFEAFPFDVTLPRIVPHEIVLPPDEPGLRPCAGWTRADGIEVPVYADRLLIGRFVCIPIVDTCGVRLSRALRERALALAERIGELIVFETAVTRMARGVRGI